MDREYSVRSLIERAFHSIGHTIVPAYEASYVSTALGLVKAGLGVAIVARSAAGEAAELVGLRTRPIDHPRLVQRISLLEIAGALVLSRRPAVRRRGVRDVPPTGLKESVDG
jgi:LysR family carnitine catabolism transcriptional activator